MPFYPARMIPDSTIPNSPIREHCSVHHSQITTIVRDKDQQVRIERYARDGVTLLDFALYTVTAVHDKEPDVVFVGYRDPESTHQDLEKRLGLSSTSPFIGRVNSQVTDDELNKDNGFVEHLIDNGKHLGLIVIAPHGGNIEPHTDEQAEHVGKQLASKYVSVWVCKGLKQGNGAFNRWHITSTDISEESFPKLKTVIERRFEYAVAFHGWDEDSICIGGSAPASLKHDIKTAIQSVISGIDVCTEEDNCCPANFNGNDPGNIVNRLAVNGIQIEQSKNARSQKYCIKIADAVADVIGPRIEVCSAPVFEGMEFWTCLMEGISDSVLTMSSTGTPSIQCEIKRLQFRIQNYSQGNSDPRIEL
jgi:phage replication-related protein YjqB (UPF0714/DUF867 family)